MAVLYDSVVPVVAEYGDALAGKAVVDISNPFNAAADGLAVSEDTSVAQEAAKAVYQAAYAKLADQIRETGQFHEPEQWRFGWEQSCAREQWLALLPTTGGLTRLRPDQLADILNEVGTAIDALGGASTLHSTTLATSAARVSAS